MLESWNKPSGSAVWRRCRTPKPRPEERGPTRKFGYVCNCRAKEDGTFRRSQRGEMTCLWKSFSGDAHTFSKHQGYSRTRTTWYTSSHPKGNAPCCVRQKTIIPRNTSRPIIIQVSMGRRQLPPLHFTSSVTIYCNTIFIFFCKLMFRRSGTIGQNTKAWRPLWIWHFMHTCFGSDFTGVQMKVMESEMFFSKCIAFIFFYIWHYFLESQLGC